MPPARPPQPSRKAPRTPRSLTLHRCSCRARDKPISHPVGDHSQCHMEEGTGSKQRTSSVRAWPCAAMACLNSSLSIRPFRSTSHFCTAPQKARGSRQCGSTKVHEAWQEPYTPERPLSHLGGDWRTAQPANSARALSAAPRPLSAAVGVGFAASHAFEVISMEVVAGSALLTNFSSPLRSKSAFPYDRNHRCEPRRPGTVDNGNCVSYQTELVELVLVHLVRT